MTYVFVYSKNGKIKVLDMEKSLKKHDKLISDGWIQTASLHAIAFIEYLCNESGNIQSDVKALLTI